MQVEGLQEPIFQKQGIFTVTFPRPKDEKRKMSEKMSEKSSEKSSEKTLQLIKENKFITTEELANKVGITTRGIEKHLKKLKDDNFIIRVGPDKGGHWLVLNKNINQ